MGFSIQFESQHVELWGCYTMERDNNVLVMYDQPTRIQLHYHAHSGRKTSPWHTPDFLVLRRDGAGFEQTLREAREVPTSFASRLFFDGRLWEANIEATTVILRPEIGAELRLPSEHFQRLVASGEIKEVTDASPSPLADSVREIVSHAGPKALEATNRRLHVILAYRYGEAITVTARSIQNWLAAFRRAEAEHGCGYFGLLDKLRERGNRKARVPDASRQLLSEYVTAHYPVPQAKRAAAVYRLYREECTRQGIPLVGERTFYRERTSI
jgi:hypothetical protein